MSGDADRRKLYSRVFFGSLLFFFLGTWLYLASFLVIPEPWPDPDSHYRDRNAAFAGAMFIVSSCFFSVFFLAHHFVIVPEDIRMLWARTVDLFWYPAGIVAVLLALSSTSQSTLTHKRASLHSDTNYLISVINANIQPARMACDIYQENEFDMKLNSKVRISVHNSRMQRSFSRRGLDEPISRTDFFLGDIIKPLCLALNSRTEPVSFLGIDDIRYNPLLTEACEKSKFGERVFFNRNSFGWRYIDIEISSIPREFDGNVKEKFMSLIIVCTGTSLTKELLEKLDQYSGAISSIYKFQNPWIWIVLVLSIGGMKISKVVIELAAYIRKTWPASP